MKTSKSSYYINEKDEFIIEDYNRQKPFSSFLPAIAGPYGKPMWAYYVNRGQCICTFGINNKDYSIMEFLPANKAYRQTSLQGFRTFLKITNETNHTTTYYEPFQDQYQYKIYEIQQKMVITSYDLKLEEINRTLGFKIEAMFCTLPGENMAGLIRKVEITNLKENSLKIEVLDGMPMIIPNYLIDMDMKSMSNLRQAWMSVDHYNTLPFCRIKALPYDTPETVLMEGGNFFLNFDFEKGKLRLSKTIVEPYLIFGNVTDFSYPEKFMEEGFGVPDVQVDLGVTPCGFGYKQLVLQKDESDVTYTLIGSAERFEKLSTFVDEKLTLGYMENKIRENRTLVESCKTPILTSSSSKEFDLYCGQTFMDNFLRGGFPVKLGNERHHFYLYSRKHGDLEREYNFFQIDATNYSQGNSNFRDVNQNRRNDVYFFPFIEDGNIKTFFNLLQLDGFNPLVLKGSRFEVENKEKAEELTLQYFDGEDQVSVLTYIKRAFTPGAILGFLELNGCSLKKGSPDSFLNELLAFCSKEDLADFQEGYWVDHWIYNNDLLEQFLQVYPDRAVELLFGNEQYTYYDNHEIVVPRTQRHVLTESGVRQFGSLKKVPEKEKMIKARVSQPNAVRTDYGKGEVYHSSLISKIVCLIVNKIASMDPDGVGVEMEGNKPGWCDALNGLPAILGSSINESTEIKRLADLLLTTLHENEVGNGNVLKVPEELYEFYQKITGLLTGEKEGMAYWDGSNSAKEAFRAATIFGVSGIEKELSVGELREFLARVSSKVEKGLQKAFDPASGVYNTYFINEAVEYEVVKAIDSDEPRKSNGYPCVRVLQFRQRPIPFFLEGPVHVLRLEKDPQKARALHQAIQKTGLYDEKLDMYKVNANIMEETKEIGRQNVFPRGWLENEAVFLHMEYKYFLELLRAGLYDEFFHCFQNALIPFLEPAVYGRSILENSSFIASSVHTDAKIHGTGFVSRLTGASAEFLNLWRFMTAGQKLFFLDEDGSLSLKLSPVLPGWLFTKEEKALSFYKQGVLQRLTMESGSFSFMLLGSVLTTYHNPSGKNTYGADGVKIKKLELYRNGNLIGIVNDDVIGKEYAAQIRNGTIDRIEAYLQA